LRSLSVGGLFPFKFETASTFFRVPFQCRTSKIKLKLNRNKTVFYFSRHTFEINTEAETLKKYSRQTIWLFI